MKLLVLIVLVFIGSGKAQEIIDWQAEGLVWANNCEFVGNDIYTVNVSFEDCRFRACRDQSGCTHFNYVSQAGVGTCTMKKGPVTLKDAKFKNTLADTKFTVASCGIYGRSSQKTNAANSVQSSQFYNFLIISILLVLSH
jgi:hypothetical protein